jgi:hypothetical protein
MSQPSFKVCYWILIQDPAPFCLKEGAIEEGIIVTKMAMLCVVLNHITVLDGMTYWIRFPTTATCWLCATLPILLKALPTIDTPTPCG